eukprot:360667-Chlamydomonas_euryale.AAC.1
MECFRKGGSRRLVWGGGVGRCRKDSPSGLADRVDPSLPIRRHCIVVGPRSAVGRLIFEASRARTIRQEIQH